MKDRSQALNLAVSVTVSMLLSAGLLVILSIFNGSLHWDIFSPKVEQFFYAIFGSCIALACVCVAITLVLGVNEIVRGYRLVLLALGKHTEQTPAKNSSAKLFYTIFAVFASVIVLFGIANHIVQKGREHVFNRIANEQHASFAPKLLTELQQIPTPPRDHVPQNLFNYLMSLDKTDAFSRATLYIPDPTEKGVFWGYTAWRGSYAAEDGFARAIPVKPFEKSLVKTFEQGEAALAEASVISPFEFYGAIADRNGKVLGILRLDADQHESFRDY